METKQARVVVVKYGDGWEFDNEYRYCSSLSDAEVVVVDGGKHPPDCRCGDPMDKLAALFKAAGEFLENYKDGDWHPRVVIQEDMTYCGENAMCFEMVLEPADFLDTGTED